MQAKGLSSFVIEFPNVNCSLSSFASGAEKRESREEENEARGEAEASILTKRVDDLAGI